MIEANPRASRTVPFVSKAIGVPLAKVACRLMLGERLADMRARHPAPAAARLGQGGGAAVRALPARRRAARPGDEVDRRGDGRRADYPTAFGKAQAAAGAELPASGTVFITVTDGDKPAATQLAALAPRPGLQHRRHRRHRAGDPAHGRAGRADQEDLRGLAERGRPDRVGRGRPGDQHADRLGRARGRLRDPPRRDRARHPVHHDDDGRQRGPARDPRRRSGEAEVRSLQELHGGGSSPRPRFVREAREPELAGRPSRARSPRSSARLRHVTRSSELGAYNVIRALDRGGPARPQPGQFYMLRRADGWGGGADGRPYLPRAFSFARVREATGRWSFLLEAVGPGTERLAELEPGDGLWAGGPARASAGGLPREGTRPLLVGGGIGAAPLLCWQEELRAGDAAEPQVLLGFRSAAHAEAAALFAGAPRARHRRRLGRPPGARHRAAARGARRATRRRRSTPAGRRRCSRRCGRSAPSAGCRPSSRWSPAWPAASAPASAAWCRRATATCACAWTGRCSMPPTRDGAGRGTGH